MTNLKKFCENKKIMVTLLIIYIILILKITVFRSGFSFDKLFSGGKLNLEIFTDLWRILSYGNINTFLYLFLGNIVWFIPYGFLMPLSFLSKNKYEAVNSAEADNSANISLKKSYSKREVRRKLTITVISGALFSFTIEVLQFICATGVSEIDDIILNTFGVFVGFVVWWILFVKRERV